MLRNTFIFGESYCFVTWNKDKGDLHPDYVKARAMGMPLQMIGDDGQPVLDDQGQPMKISPDTPVKIGDVDYTVECPWRVHLQRQKNI